MSIITAIRVSRAPFTGLGVIGLYWGVMAAMMPDIKAQAGVSDGLMGISLLGSAFGGVVAIWLGPWLAARTGKWLLPGLVAATMLAIQLPILATAPWAFFPMMLVLGLMTASLDIGSNMRISQLEERHGLHLMNINHAMFSFSFGMSALVVGMLRAEGWTIAMVMPAAALVFGLMGLFTWEGARWRPVEPEEGGEAPPAGLPWVVIIATAVMLFVAFVGENSIEAWSALFIERTLGGAPGEGGFGPATLGLVMAFFRLIGQVTTERLGEERVVTISGVLGVIGLTVIATAATKGIALSGIAITAIGMAVIVPTANSLLGKLVHREQRALAISRAWVIGFSGYFIGPSMIGLVSEIWSLRVAYGLAAVLVATVIPAVAVIHNRRKALGR